MKTIKVGIYSNFFQKKASERSLRSVFSQEVEKDPGVLLPGHHGEFCHGCCWGRQRPFHVERVDPLMKKCDPGWFFKRNIWWFLFTFCFFCSCVFYFSSDFPAPLLEPGVILADYASTIWTLGSFLGSIDLRLHRPKWTSQMVFTPLFLKWSQLSRASEWFTCRFQPSLYLKSWWTTVCGRWVLVVTLKLRSMMSSHYTSIFMTHVYLMMFFLLK